MSCLLERPPPPLPRIGCHCLFHERPPLPPPRTLMSPRADHLLFHERLPPRSYRRLTNSRRIIKDYNIRGVFGPLLELKYCDKKNFTTAKVASGYSLFHVVVETDGISTCIIKQLTSEKYGRVTFIPLNRVIALHIDYPHNPDMVPLLKQLNFRSEYGVAFKQ